MVNPSPELLNNNPNFANAWDKISQQINHNGVLLAAASIGAHAEEKLEASRTRYLEVSCLLEALELELYTVTSSSSSEAEVATSTPTKVQGAADRQLLGALAALKVSQRLRLPEGLQPNTGVPPPTDIDPNVLGSKDHYLGVQPEEVIPSHLSCTCAPERVEALLVGKAREVKDVMYRLSNHTDMGKPPEVVIARKLEAVAAADKARRTAFTQAYRATCRCMETLHDHVNALLMLVCSCKLQRQIRVDEADIEYRTQHVHTLYKKALQMEANFLMQTYVQPAGMDIIKVCRSMSQLLEAAHLDAAAALKQVTSQLAAYDELGDDFQRLVREYSLVLDEQADANNTLQKFIELEQELQAELP